MKQFILTIGLAIVASIGWGQNEVILIEEDFNYPSLVNIESCGSLVSPSNPTTLFQPYDNTYYFHTAHTGGCPIYLGVFDNEFSSYQMSLAHRKGSSGVILWAIQYSIDSLEWYDVSPIIPVSDEWQTDTIVFNFPNSIENFYLRLNNFGAHIFVDEITLIGNLEEAEELLGCDTVYVEVPIIIYETDIPQECMLDGNGDGMIGINDLLNLLQYFGQWSPCDVVNMNPPPNDWEKNLMEQIPTYDPNNKKTLLKVIDASGREVEQNTPGLIFYIYEDGTVEKRMGAR